jgi:cytochrome c oxidase subunit 1
MISSIGGFLFGASQLLFIVAILSSVKGKQRASDRVWDGAHGLEWTLPSPAPYHSFNTPPKVD